MKTYAEIFEFINFADSWLGREENKPESKFRYAVSKMRKRCAKHYEEFREQVLDIDVKYCATDKDGVVLQNARGGFEFKKDDLPARNKAQRELKRKEVEMEPYFCDEVPKLSDEEREICEGFVIEESKIV